MSSLTMDKLVNLCKTRGYIYPGSEIYGGLANTWDYGPLGIELNNNIKKMWWQKFVQESAYNVGIDTGILINPQVWVTSGHVGNFNDPLIDCRNCKARFRADKLITDHSVAIGREINADGWSFDRMQDYLREEAVTCPLCSSRDFTPIRRFNMMFKTHQGALEDSQSVVYLRPETAQGIFINFRNLLVSTRRKLPLGVCQIGKAFRNEITPGNFIFRTREFEQLEMEFFCSPSSADEWFDFWRVFCRSWLLDLGLNPDHITLRDHKAEELSHYSSATTDIEFDFPFGRGELWGIANRTDYDLRCHAQVSGKDLMYLDPLTNEKYIPFCIEPSVSVSRLALAFLCDAYDEELLSDGETRTVLHLDPRLAPIKVAVVPLSKKLSEPATKVYQRLQKHWMVDFDDVGSIGKRYRRYDEVGVPFCLTYDFQSVDDDCVTIRFRDSMEQQRLPMENIEAWLFQQLGDKDKGF
ncbi:MAG: glycine--tRNA ligase [Symbiobacteriaceae bacterium]|nr:glycine--tRNA ligase [Symbiobacteriaceae bacterium]